MDIRATQLKWQQLYPDPNVWEIPIESPYIVGIYGLYNPQESLTLLGVHPIVNW